jgi:hypothetical protein
VQTARFTRCKLAGGLRNLSSWESGIKPISCFPSKQGIAQRDILPTVKEIGRIAHVVIAWFHVVRMMVPITRFGSLMSGQVYLESRGRRRVVRGEFLEVSEKFHTHDFFFGTQWT